MQGWAIWNESLQQWLQVPTDSHAGTEDQVFGVLITESEDEALDVIEYYLSWFPLEVVVPRRVQMFDVASIPDAYLVDLDGEEQ